MQKRILGAIASGRVGLGEGNRPRDTVTVERVWKKDPT
jgi:hypothetical protein